MAHPAPTREDHRAFCRAEGWEEVRSARGGHVGHRLTYELSLPDGRILRTRISHPPGRQTYAARLWSHILREQLAVDEATFWACVRDGVTPARSIARPQPRGIPSDLFHLLTTTARLPVADVQRMTRDEAIAAAQRFWSRQPDET